MSEPSSEILILVKDNTTTIEDGLASAPLETHLKDKFSSAKDKSMSPIDDDGISVSDDPVAKVLSTVPPTASLEKTSKVSELAKKSKELSEKEQTVDKEIKTLEKKKEETLQQEIEVEKSIEETKKTAKALEKAGAKDAASDLMVTIPKKQEQLKVLKDEQKQQVKEIKKKEIEGEMRREQQKKILAVIEEEVKKAEPTPTPISKSVVDPTSRVVPSINLTPKRVENIFTREMKYEYCIGNFASGDSTVFGVCPVNPDKTCPATFDSQKCWKIPQSK